MELEEFLQYVINLEFDTTPDYDHCRGIFKGALKKRKYPLDGKIDFTTPKSPVKKVRTPMSPKKSARSSRRSPSPDPESDPESSESESYSPSPPPPTKAVRKKSAPAKAKPKTTAAKKRSASIASVVTSNDVGCQTSPAFVKAAKAAKRAKASASSEMDEFVEKAVSSARKATAKARVASKSPVARKKRNSSSKRRSAAASGEDDDDDGLSNPTPAMKALMEKKAGKEAEAAAKRKKSRSKK